MSNGLLWSAMRKSIMRVLVVGGQIIKWGVIGHVTLEYVAAVVICQGESMEPTLSTGDIVLTEHVTPRFGQVNRGDIIVARSPGKPTEHICKRIIAVGGDILECNRTDGTVASLPMVPRGHVWVEGDNIGNSTDSRDYGPIPLGLIRGRVLFKIWPPRSICCLIPSRSEY